MVLEMADEEVWCLQVCAQDEHLSPCQFETIKAGRRLLAYLDHFTYHADEKLTEQSRWLRRKLPGNYLCSPKNLNLEDDVGRKVCKFLVA